MRDYKKIIELLKSGDFTIAYHDNDSPYLYKKKLEYDDLPEKEYYQFDSNHDGYIPEVVFLLVKALGGATETI